MLPMNYTRFSGVCMCVCVCVEPERDSYKWSDQKQASVTVKFSSWLFVAHGYFLDERGGYKLLDKYESFRRKSPRSNEANIFIIHQN